MYYNKVDSRPTSEPSVNPVPSSSTTVNSPTNRQPQPISTMVNIPSTSGLPVGAIEQPQHDISGQWYDPTEISLDDSPPITRRPVGSSTEEQSAFWRSQTVANWPNGMRLPNGELPTEAMHSMTNVDAHEFDVCAHALRLNTSLFWRHSLAATNIA